MKYKEVSSYYEQEVNELRYFEHKLPRQAELEAIVNDLKQREMIKKCDAEGHKIVDESYGNPDSGAIQGYCRRCGWSYHTVLY